MTHHLSLILSPTYSPLFFFFNDTATTEIYTLSLHDALPICHAARRVAPVVVDAHELQVREQRADVPRLEERQERVPPPAFVPERFAHQPRRRRVRARRRVARGGGGRLRRRGGRHRLGRRLGLRLGLGRRPAGDEQRHDDSRELSAHGLAPPTFAEIGRASCRERV